MRDTKSFDFSFGIEDARRLFYYLVAVEVILVVIYLLLHLLLRDLRWGPLAQFFDLDRDLSIPSWFSAVQLCAASLALFAVYRYERNHRWFIGLSAWVVLFLSVDEGAGLHETVTHFARNNNITLLQSVMIAGRGAWIVPYLVAGALLLAVCIRPVIAIFQQHRVPSWYVSAGALTAITGAVGMEIISYLFLRDGHELLYTVEVAVEEFMEMLGVSLIFFGIMRYAIEIQSGSKKPA